MHAAQPVRGYGRGPLGRQINFTNLPINPRLTNITLYQYELISKTSKIKRTRAG